MSGIRASVAALALAWALGAVPRPAAAQGDDAHKQQGDDAHKQQGDDAHKQQGDDAYKQLVGQAMAEWDRGNWAESRALFLQAHRERPNARTWRALGKTAFELRRYVTAMRELQASLASTDNPLTADQQGEVRGLLERARTFVGSYEVSLSPPGAQLLVDGKPAELDEGRVLFLSVGSHRLDASADGHQPLQRSIVVEGGERDQLQLALTPAASPAPVVAPASVAAPAVPAPTPQATPAPVAAPPAAPPPASPPAYEPPAPEVTAEPTPAAASESDAASEPGPFEGRTWTWVALGGSAAFGIAAAAFWSSSGSAFDDVVEQCRGSCTVEEIEAVIDDSGGRTYDTLTNVAISLSTASLIAAVALYVLEGRAVESRGDADGGFTLRTAPGGATLGGRF